MNVSKPALFLSGLFFGGAVDHAILAGRGGGKTPLWIRDWRARQLAHGRGISSISWCSACAQVSVGGAVPKSDPPYFSVSATRVTVDAGKCSSFNTRPAKRQLRMPRWFHRQDNHRRRRASCESANRISIARTGSSCCTSGARLISLGSWIQRSDHHSWSELDCVPPDGPRLGA